MPLAILDQRNGKEVRIKCEKMFFDLFQVKTVQIHALRVIIIYWMRLLNELNLINSKFPYNQNFPFLSCTFWAREWLGSGGHQVSRLRVYTKPI